MLGDPGLLHHRERGLETETGAFFRRHLRRHPAERLGADGILVADLLERAFRGSASKLVQHVLEAKAATPEELAEIRRMIDEASKGGREK